MRHLDLHFGSLSRQSAAAGHELLPARRDGAKLSGVILTIFAFAVLMAALLAGLLLRLWVYFFATAPLHS